MGHICGSNDYQKLILSWSTHDLDFRSSFLLFLFSLIISHFLDTLAWKLTRFWFVFRRLSLFVSILKITLRIVRFDSNNFQKNYFHVFYKRINVFHQTGNLFCIKTSQKLPCLRLYDSRHVYQKYHC